MKTGTAFTIDDRPASYFDEAPPTGRLPCHYSRIISFGVLPRARLTSGGGPLQPHLYQGLVTQSLLIHFTATEPEWTAGQVVCEMDSSERKMRYWPNGSDSFGEPLYWYLPLWFSFSLSCVLSLPLYLSRFLFLSTCRCFYYSSQFFSFSSSLPNTLFISSSRTHRHNLSLCLILHLSLSLFLYLYRYEYDSTLSLCRIYIISSFFLSLYLALLLVSLYSIPRILTSLSCLRRKEKTRFHFWLFLCFQLSVKSKSNIVLSFNKPFSLSAWDLIQHLVITTVESF